MPLSILLAAIIVIICVLLNKFSNKIGIPVLLAFIVLGMLFGADGILKIPFDNYYFSEKICSVALIFIMFYGGFGTNWEQAKPTAVKSALLSTVGVALTAAITGLFCHYILRMGWTESFLIGAVISSTDAASVFSILRSRKLGLKHNTDSMLELESGSNDPCSYMLTMIMLAVINGGISTGSVVKMIFSQLIFGVLIGVVVAIIASFILRKFQFITPGFDMAFVIGVALLSYALASVLDGNGYLSTYICGIILGNVKIKNKKPLVNFFDGLTGLMQMLIFFLLGLLATPSKIIPIILPTLFIMIFLTFIARPISVFAILSPFKSKIRQQALVSFAGLRGAASIVFAIVVTVNAPNLKIDLFHIVFFIVLLSISFQGTLLPFVAKLLKMSDKNIDVMKTFNDYSEDIDLRFIKVKIPHDHPWANSCIKDITMPPDTLVVMLIRNDILITPNGKTELIPDDIAVLSAYKFEDKQATFLKEQKILPDSKWNGKDISEFSSTASNADSDGLIIMIIRDGRTIIPEGSTVIKTGDVLVINSTDYV